MNDVTTPDRRRTSTALRDFSTEPFAWLRGEIDRLFDDFPRPSRSLFTFPAHNLALIPALDMSDHDKEYRITAELPGLSDEDIEVSVTDGVLRIAGEKKEEQEGKQEGVMVNERRYGRFERQITLPGDVSPDEIKAQFRHGVLTVIVPKDQKATERSRKILIDKA